jgi:chromosome partitioning protein
VLENTLASSQLAQARWLCIASGKGGTGKTTTSLNLAVFAAHAGLSVCLVDLDSQRSLSRWHDRRPEQAPEIALWAGRFTDVRQAISEIQARGLDLVVIDTPPSIDAHPAEVNALIRRSDLVLVPTTQGTTDLDSAIEWMNYLSREGIRSAFLLNRAQRTFGTYRRAKLRLNKAGPLCPVDVRQLEDIQATHDLGVGVLEIARSRAIEDYEGLWDFVSSQLGIRHS